MKRLIIPLCLVLSCVNIELCLSQENFVAVGGNSISESSSLSYTVGQVAYCYNSNLYGDISPGLQHPYEVYIITDLSDESAIVNNFSIFPNPSSNYLNIKVLNTDFKDISFKLYDLSGNVLESAKITGSEAIIDISKYSPTEYLIQIFTGEAVIKKFRIIKN